MKKILWKVSALLLVSILSVFTFAGCGQTGKKEEQATIKLGYVNWAEGVAMTNLAQAILEDKMGYEVETTMADAAPIFTSVAKGNYDAFLDAWLPVTHESYMEKYGDDIVNLGTNYEGARIGLVVPEYVDIDSIGQLNDVKDKFGGRIVGIDSGAGIMMATDKAIPEYGLEYEVVPGSGPTMTAALKKAIDKKEWVVVTGWAPHWKFAKWDLKFLEDPKGIYGEAEHIDTVARKNLEEDLPDVAQFFKNFKMDSQQLGGLMGEIAESEKDPLETAREWMNENEELVNSWLPQE